MKVEIMDKRKEKRTLNAELPQNMREIIFMTGFFQEHKAQTCDASLKGIGFNVINFDPNSFHIGQELSIKIIPNNYKVKTRVANIKEINNKLLRIGTSFIDSYDIKKYHELFKEIKE
jgi:hypothetical protein